MNPGGGSGWDEPPLEVQIPDDARELDRDVIAYHRELRARRRRRRLRRVTAPLHGQGTVMPLLASILAVCLVAGAMLSVATFSPATGPGHRSHPSATATKTSATQSAQNSGSANSTTGASTTGASTTGTSITASPSAGARVTARPSGSANSSAFSSTGYRVPASQVRPGATIPPHPPGGP
ncbi:MAG: hypothetical protein ACRDOA_14960 [Streptosporangiaceae bacterium]